MLICSGAIAIMWSGLVAAAAQTTTSNVEPSLLERAFVLDEGKTQARDAAAAARLYEAAAEAGDTAAQVRLGYMYETGDGVARDVVRARANYTAAAKAGSVEGLLHLAICDLEGWGGPADRQKFVAEVSQAAEAGYAPAQEILASIYQTGLFVPANKELSLQWFEKAAAQNSAAAQLALGKIVESERLRGLNNDRALARTWFQRSAQQDYAQAMIALARTFLVTDQKSRDWKLGRQWLLLATESGDAEAPYILAVTEMLHVDSPTRNPQQAMQWLLLADERQNDRAHSVITYARRGEPLEKAMRHALNQTYEERYIETHQVRADSVSGDRPPQPLRIARCEYPEGLLLTGTSGEALIEFTVDQEGRTNDPKVISATHPLFGEGAVRAIAEWQFLPGIKNGKPVSTRMRIPLYFSLRDELLEGAEGLIKYARSLAKNINDKAYEDSRELRMAKVTQAAPSGALPPDAFGLVMLVLDEKGAPLRHYLLQAKPTDIGPKLLQTALANRYVPLVLADKPLESSVLVVFAGPSSHPTSQIFKP